MANTDIYRNFAYCKTTADIDTSDTSVTVDDLSQLPSQYDLDNAGGFWMTFDSALSYPNTFEIVRLTGIDAETNTITFVRGEEGGTSAHTSGTMLKGTITAGMLSRAAGAYVGSGPPNDVVPSYVNQPAYGSRYLDEVHDYEQYIFVGSGWRGINEPRQSYVSGNYFPSSPNPVIVTTHAYDGDGNDVYTPVTGDMTGGVRYSLFVPFSAYNMQGSAFTVTEDTTTLGDGTSIASIFPIDGVVWTYQLQVALTGLNDGDIIHVRGAVGDSFFHVMSADEDALDTGVFKFVHTDAVMVPGAGSPWQNVQVTFQSSSTSIEIYELISRFDAVSGRFAPSFTDSGGGI